MIAKRTCPTFVFPLIRCVCVTIAVISVCPITAAADKPAGTTSAPSFRHDVIPLLTRYGCNQGGCHGKQAGQNGFRLSLRGFAIEWDHDWLTREFDGRRISRVAPDQSLVLRKPLGQMPHGGGKLFAEGSRAHQVLSAWIEAGAPGPLSDEPLVERLEVVPDATVLRPGESQHLTARAYFTDGRQADVTWLCQFFSSDESVVTVTPDGLVQAQRAGEVPVRVHFQQEVEVVTFTIPQEGNIAALDPAEYQNDIDRHVFEKLASLQIPSSPRCDDATFLRRAMLDTIGTLPTAEEAREFLADSSSDKRNRLVDTLLDRPEFVDYWTLQLADLLQNRKERDHDVRGTKGVRAMHEWLRRQVAANRPWNEIARDVLTATGDSVQVPAIGYYVVTVGEKRPAEQSEVAASVAQAFLGTRIGCAECHNHPLEKYTQDDYHHFAAFFSRISFDRKKPAEAATTLFVASQEESQLRRRIEQTEQKLAELKSQSAPDDEQEAEKLARQREQQQKQLEQLRDQLAQASQRPVEIRQPRTGQMLRPQPLDRADVNAGQDPREALVDWMTADDNEYFSGAMVNRLWRHFLGTGLVEPVDDLRPSNPPSNRPLWESLNREFVSSGFDLKHVMRLILNSRTYQLSSATLPENADDQRFYSHYYARRLPAEVMLDAVSQCSGVPEHFPGYPRGVRAIQVPDPGVDSYFMSLFGKSARVTACACERGGDVTLPQLLHMQNGDWIGAKLRGGDARLRQWQADWPDDKGLAEHLFLTTLSRPPSESELARVVEVLQQADDRHAAVVDVMWALINTKEFAFNH